MGKGILAGYKTYIVAILSMIGAVAAYFMGDAELANTAQLVLTAILGMTIRKGISTDS